MNALLEQFLSESRESLQHIVTKLMQLEKEPGSSELITELFRLVHTLKGNSGLFDYPELTRVLHAGEDLMEAVRCGTVTYAPLMADRLLDAMDFVGLLCDEIEAKQSIDPSRARDSFRLAELLRVAINEKDPRPEEETSEPLTTFSSMATAQELKVQGLLAHKLARIPEDVRMASFGSVVQSNPLHWLHYRPAEDCFFQGEDPFFQARQTPGLVWGALTHREPWPELAELDAYRCLLDFEILSMATLEELNEFFRYVADQVTIEQVPREALIIPKGEPNGGPVDEVVVRIVEVQRRILALPDDISWLAGRIRGVGATLSGCLPALGRSDFLASLEQATEAAVAAHASEPLLAWLNQMFPPSLEEARRHLENAAMEASQPLASPALPNGLPVTTGTPPAESDVKFGRRAEDALTGAKVLKVDQAKIDRLMNLIGEMVVAKNALPYLAGRAESVYGVRDLSREIKTQYAVINRIAEEMQDSIMQVRMMPVSFIFQRFPRLIRDISHRLGKEVNLVLEGEDTEADKSIIEALGDPLVHIVRNSLDHGIEQPEVRLKKGKPSQGTLLIRASQESDRVIITIKDDGKGIDPEVIKHKAYAKGLLDEDRMGRMNDQEAIHLIFAPGFSTADEVSDLSGRGVGMDVVRTAVEKVNGSLLLESRKDAGTCLRLSLPLSMAITNVMIIESDSQIFGVPMDTVAETVRVRRSDIRLLKNVQTMILRGRIVPLKSLNTLLGLTAPPKANAEDEFAVLVVSHGEEPVGILVDNFRESVDIILKPMAGVLTGLTAYSGSALLGDGSVLMVLNFKELL